MARPPLPRVALLGLGAVALVTGVWAGLLRLGWALPVPRADLVLLHGPLMIAGFFATVIGIERAVGVPRAWAWLAPLGAGLGAVLLLAGAPMALGAAVQTAGALAMLAAYVAVLRHDRGVHVVTMTLGAAALLAGDLRLALGATVAQVVPAWAAFLVLTITGERLELSRFVAPHAARLPAFVVAVALTIAGLALDLPVVTGAAWLAFAAWGFAFDAARRTLRQPGLPRFAAVCLLSGYAWLAVAGAWTLLGDRATAGLGFDARMHALWLGFVFAMVFGHAPIILPAVARLAVPFRPGFYLHLALLEASLLLRVVGDGLGDLTLRRWGGLGNALALLAFILATARAVRGARQGRSDRNSA